jgi:hypothetical protein
MVSARLSSPPRFRPSWHERLADPTMADAICDRVIHNAHVIAIRGPSIREKKGMLTDPTQPTT